MAKRIDQVLYFSIEAIKDSPESVVGPLDVEG